YKPTIIRNINQVGLLNQTRLYFFLVGWDWWSGTTSGRLGYRRSTSRFITQFIFLKSLDNHNTLKNKNFEAQAYPTIFPVRVNSSLSKFLTPIRFFISTNMVLPNDSVSMSAICSLPSICST